MSAALRSFGKPALPGCSRHSGTKIPGSEPGPSRPSAASARRGRAGRPGPMDALLRDKDLMVRELAVLALGSIGSTQVQKVVPARPRPNAVGLRRHGVDEDLQKVDPAGPRNAVVMSVQEIGPASKLVPGPAGEGLARRFPARSAVAAEQGLIGLGPLAVPVLIKAAKNPDRTLRLHAIGAPGHDPPDRARDGQRTGWNRLKTRTAEVRGRAVQGLGNLGQEGHGRDRCLARDPPPRCRVGSPAGCTNAARGSASRPSNR